MPSDDYASFSGGGALKLKGGKVGKPKKKKKEKANIERSLSTGEASGSKELDRKAPAKDAEAEKAQEGKDDEDPSEYKTEAQRRHEEVQRKKMLKLSEFASARPELLKTHKERVEELNTYLSKLSEHHDMPKIGPG